MSVGKLFDVFKYKYHETMTKVKKLKVRLPNGSEIKAMDVDFDTIKEDWNEYKLEDGTVLKFKTVISSIIRTEDHDPMTGDPVYHVRSTNILRARVQDELKQLPARKKSGGEVEGVEVG